MSPISTHSQIDITETQKHAPKQYLSWNPPSFAIHLITPYISIYFKFFSHRSSELGSWTGPAQPSPQNRYPTAITADVRSLSISHVFRSLRRRRCRNLGKTHDIRNCCCGWIVSALRVLAGYDYPMKEERA